MNETQTEIASWLDEHNWKEGNVARHERFDRQWFKTFPGEPKCATNDPKPLQLRVLMWNEPRYGEGERVGLEIELYGEPVDDGGWIVFKAYAFDSVEDIPDQIERLFVAWRAVCAAV